MPIATIPQAAARAGMLVASATNPRPTLNSAIAAGASRCSPTRVTTRPDQQALHNGQDDADPCEQIPDGHRGRTRSALGCRARTSTRSCANADTIRKNTTSTVGRRGRFSACSKACRRVRRRAVVRSIRRQRFGQQHQRRNEVHERQRRGEERRRLIAPLAEEPAERRAEDESQAERRADHPHPLRTVLGGRRIGDEGLRRRDVGAGHPGQASRRRTATRATAARPNVRYETADPSRPIRITGRRPNTSDQRPQSGANRNCISENDVASIPTSNADAPKWVA